jgi:hypothetical protein
MNTFEYIIKKYGIKVGRQYIIDIPNMGSVDLAKLFAELGFKTGVEVGVFNGDYSKMLCENNPSLHLYSVDSWRIDEYPEGFLEQSHPRTYKGITSAEQKYYDEAFVTATNKLKPFNCTILKKTSMQALADFPDNSLDFVYLDAGHDWYNFTLDLHFWKNKVRPGGILAGHDYSGFKKHKMIHVKQVLQGYSRCYDMIPYFVLPRRREKPRRDLYGNWFLVKK